MMSKQLHFEVLEQHEAPLSPQTFVHQGQTGIQIRIAQPGNLFRVLLIDWRNLAIGRPSITPRLDGLRAKPIPTFVEAGMTFEFEFGGDVANPSDSRRSESNRLRPVAENAKSMLKMIPRSGMEREPRGAKTPTLANGRTPNLRTSNLPR
ncbi:uncharacterized protein BCR38DRAFT_487830 [Pseudomassariella vexata]|uniref:Uncharacterized protein n=1 Tax=Pseudomassariella vexata TaxID=1141098 RepID=A0A1Y2DNC9_9PEZI|nr:uncharacterized protein BCR38DRAFT_487830 [Pseudomassariella vexata]ORY60771.1 hypothetical protein BCR38DRAFT_487830 [Pseudomassariella vexata]